MSGGAQFGPAEIWCVIPVHNNAATIVRTATACHARLPNVVVVDDGSTDADLPVLLADTGVTVLRHPVNRGKGAALLTALRYVASQQGRWMITLDGDGQHDPHDLHRFLDVLTAARNDDFLIVGVRDMAGGNAPRGSRFGKAFSNGWVRLETGLGLEDTQSGFRAYPVRHLERLRFKGRHFDFEIEALVKLAWGGLEVREVPVSVWYPGSGRRVTSFRPVLDNVRLSLIHSMLVGRRLLPWPQRRLVGGPRHPWQEPFRQLAHPLAFLKRLLHEHATPAELGIAAAAGIFLGALPLLFIHTAVIAYVAIRLRLNKIMALTIQSLCMPPFVPLACIQTGHFLRHGKILYDFSWSMFRNQLGERLWEWFLGSLFLAPFAAVTTGILVYAIARALHRRRAGSGTEERKDGKREAEAAKSF